MSIVTIVGSGMMGSALAFPARENGHEVRLVGTHLDREIIDACRRTGRHPKFKRDFPEGIRYYQIEELEEALKGSDLVIGGVSSFGVEWFRDYVLEKIPENTDVLTVTKGLMDTEDGSLLCYPQLWQKKLDEMGKKLNLCAVGGPCTSYELVAHDQTEVCFCGADAEALKRIKKIMATGYYHISLSSDIVGIESAVALKNGYALGVALTVGGLYLLCMKGESLSFVFSDMLVLLCALGFACHIMVIDKFVTEVDAVCMSALQFLVTGLLTAVPMYVLELDAQGFATWWLAVTLPLGWSTLCFAGVMSSGVAYTLQIVGQKGMNPTVASLLMSLESVFAVLAGWAILDEQLSSRELWGCGLIFVAVVLAQLPISEDE